MSLKCWKNKWVTEDYKAYLGHVHWRSSHWPLISLFLLLNYRHQTCITVYVLMAENELCVSRQLWGNYVCVHAAPSAYSGIMPQLLHDLFPKEAWSDVAHGPFVGWSVAVVQPVQGQQQCIRQQYLSEFGISPFCPGISVTVLITTITSLCCNCSLTVPIMIIM